MRESWIYYNPVLGIFTRSGWSHIGIHHDTITNGVIIYFLFSCWTHWTSENFQRPRKDCVTSPDAPNLPSPLWSRPKWLQVKNEREAGQREGRSDCPGDIWSWGCIRRPKVFQEWVSAAPAREKRLGQSGYKCIKRLGGNAVNRKRRYDNTGTKNITYRGCLKCVEGELWKEKTVNKKENIAVTL